MTDTASSDAASSEAGRRRRVEQLGGAGLRALACDPAADLRAGRVVVGPRPRPVVVPYLVVDLASLTDVERRGVTDALGLRVRHSDHELHSTLSPEPIVERVVFDIAEQLRCESLVADPLTGVGSNIAAAFDRWAENAVAQHIGDTGVGLLVFTVTHMMRYRLVGRPSAEAVDEVIETTRGNLARLVGHALRQLAPNAGDQRAFATPAREIARLVAEVAADGDERDDEASDAVARNRLLVPIDWDAIDQQLADAVVPDQPIENPVGDYHVFTDAYDRVVAGADLYRPDSLRRLRAQLDQASAAQAVSVPRLAQRLQRLFATHRIDGWSGGHEHGELDRSRLARIVTNPLDPEIRRLPAERPVGDAAVTLLIDTSGSMKQQRYEEAAVMVDTLARALEMAGVTIEVLGFSTGAWNGGRARKDWEQAGSPPNPGRLAEALHIVYKPADSTWRQSRNSLAAMLRTDHYREGIDGEALVWAADRLAARPEPRRYLVLLSDGWPMEAATANANRDRFLVDHLRSVVSALEGHGHGGRHRRADHAVAPVAVGAVCLEQSLGRIFTRSVTAELDQALTLRSYDVLNELFDQRSRTSGR